MPEDPSNISQEHTHNATWDAVDEYITHTLPHTDDALQAAREANTAAELPAIDVAPNQGKFLHLIALATGAKRILEIGTLGGYSSIWLARSLPSGGNLITLEFEPRHAEVAWSNLKRAGVDDKVQIRVGPASVSLEQLYGENAGPFDLIFIDADKPNNSLYLDWALKLSRAGTVIVVDNVVREGELAAAASTDPAVVGTRLMFERMAAEPRLEATALQTVGVKGYDGFAMAVVVA